MRAFRQDDVFRSIHVLDGRLSPDASFAVYLVSETVAGKKKEEDRQATSLWRVDLAGGQPRRLTAKGGNVSGLTKAPDGKSVLFVSARDPEGKRPQIHRLPLDGGEAEAITSLDQGVGAFALSPDGKWIAFAALEKAPDPVKLSDHVRIDRPIYRFDAIPGYLQDVRQAIYVIPASGGEPKALTAHDGVFSALAWSPDGREIAASVIGREANEASYAGLGEVCVVDREGGENVLLRNALTVSLFWTSDGKQIGFFGSTDGNLARQMQLWLIDRRSGAQTSRTARLGLPIAGFLQVNSPMVAAMLRLVVTADGKDVIAPVLKGGETAPYRIALSGPESAEPLLKGPRTARPLDLVGATLLLSSQDCNTPSELWAADLKTGGEHVLSRHNAEWQKQIAWPELERVVVQSGEGAQIEGWVLKPREGKPPYKTILYIHGGPHAAFGYSYNEDFQELVGAGYALAFANPRGSVGYGDAFSTAIIGRWGHPEFEDFNALLDELVRRGISDPDKLGVTGVSGGGHLSAWLIGQTNRFKAAVPEQGVYNMFSFYGVSDAGIALITLEMGGPPHEQVQRYWDLSPIAHAHKCKTPTLLIQGENDIRCPMEQAEQLYTVLRHNGCKAELLRLRNCNHGLEISGPPPLRRFRMDAMKDWFARHL